jgi:nucleotide-binding universal stress UspA family protein
VVATAENHVRCGAGLRDGRNPKESAVIANQLDAKLIAVHAIAPLEEGLLTVIDAGASISPNSVQSAIRGALDRTGVTAQVEILVGEPSRRVAGAAKEYDANLIVIGKGGGRELPGRLGSHTYAIVRRAPARPVLCV